MYTILLSLHNILRWFVIIFATWAVVRAFQGWFGNKTWTPSDNRAGMLYTIFLDTQVLVGLILYFFVSPITTAALRNFAGTMSNPVMRYFTIEHIGLMLVAVVVAHIGRSLSTKAENVIQKHKLAAIWYSISILLILAAIPWPFLQNGRPLLRLFGITFYT